MGQQQDATLKPQLTLFDAIVTGLAAILGAGIFTIIAPATGLAGPAILVSFGIAAFVAFCNASSSIQLAAVFPRSGGTYEFGEDECLATGGGSSQAGCFSSPTQSGRV